MKTCDILLATYNGERFIADLLDSLLSQTQADFRVLARDDGSSDATVGILQEFEARFGGRLQIIGDGSPTGSPTLNFEVLMRASTADYVLFCDQDDVWLPNRVQESLRMLTEAEATFGAETPVFVFNDLVPVDANLKKVAESYWEFKKINPAMARRLAASLITSPILGCSCGINRALLNRALPIHPQATNHDWWTLHVAIMFGQVVWSAEKTVLYRLHGGNSSQQQRVRARDYARSTAVFAKVRNGLAKKARHAEGLKKTYVDAMPPDMRAMFDDFVQVTTRGFLTRRVTLLRWGLVYPDIRRNLAFLIAM